MNLKSHWDPTISMAFFMRWMLNWSLPCAAAGKSWKKQAVGSNCYFGALPYSQTGTPISSALQSSGFYLKKAKKINLLQQNEWLVPNENVIRISALHLKYRC